MVRSFSLLVIISVVMCASCGKRHASDVANVSSVETDSPEYSGPIETPAASRPMSEPPEPLAAEVDQDTPHAATAGADAAAEQQTEPPSTSATENEPDGPAWNTTDVLVQAVEPDVVEAAAWPPAYRMFLPTTAGPLIVDVEIWLGDELIADVFDRRIKEVMQQAKVNSKTELTWPDLFKHVSDDTEQFGRQNDFNRGQYRQLVGQFDRNRNQRPDHDEVARFLFRNNGLDTPFRLIGTNYHREINRSESRLFKAIDQNRDNAIDQDELAAAPHALLRFDPNADQRIDPGELMGAEDNDPAWDRRRSNRRGEVAMDFAGYVDWTMVSYSIESIRGRTPFAAAEDPIDRIDENGDRSISSSEAKRLSEGDADLRWKVVFATDGSNKPSIEVVWLRPELKSLNVTHRSPADVAMTDGAFTLLATVTDRQSSRNRIPRPAFDVLDANRDGVLQEDEIPDAISTEFSFAELDADGDGNLTYQEINSAPQAARQPIWIVQVRARAAEFPDGIFAWLDTDHDRVLSTREILMADERLRQCSSKGQVLRPTDIPDTFAVQFMHADPMQDQQNFVFAPSINAAVMDWPRWAQNMDVNRDGDISEIEFPGTASQFGQLDGSGDGYIDADEIAIAK